RPCLLRRRAADDSCHGGNDGEVFNEVLLPFLEVTPADRVAATAAEEVDAFLLAVPGEVVEATLARPDRPNLDRGFHRDHHLDRIERALAEAGYAWPRHRTGHGRGRPHAHRVGAG